MKVIVLVHTIVRFPDSVFTFPVKSKAVNLKSRSTGRRFSAYLRLPTRHLSADYDFAEPSDVSRYGNSSFVPKNVEAQYTRSYSCKQTFSYS